jgi:hypothetical protein
VYLPASTDVLRLLVDGRPWSASRAFAVTPAVRAADPGRADEEELEFLVFLQAAHACLTGPGAAPARRVVVSADVAADSVHPVDDLAAVVLDLPLLARQVAAVHVDDAEGAAAVAQVLAGAPPERLDEVALLWFAASELDLALAEAARG